ncbi:hypothetical protein [Coprococcus eutactus]|uniref:hypothetical protein n=1 Tax=Coprococcus TaxID=33042 RepID=UPI003B5078F5
MIGGADGPMVLFASLKLAPELFVPISLHGFIYTKCHSSFMLLWHLLYPIALCIDLTDCLCHVLHTLL